MGGLLVSLTPMQRISPIDKNAFRSSSNVGKLDVVVGSNQGEGVQKQSSLSKVAKFQPTQLKNFSSSIGSSASRRKQTSQIRSAEQSLVKEKVQEIRSQNPFTNKSPAEKNGGAKVNIST